MAAGRRTIARPATLEGVGLHLGQSCRMTFRPAPSGQGITFRRADVDGATPMRAEARNAVLTERRTQIGEGEGAFHTVEHVLAAVAGLELDDLAIELDAPEPPIMDGSAEPFRAALNEAGVITHRGEVEYLRLAEPVRLVDGDSIYEAAPSRELVLKVRIEFPHPLIGVQDGEWTLSGGSEVGAAFARDLAPARTFGFMHEIDLLRSRGLALGGSTDNAIVLDDSGVVGNTLRWPDEFVRHKALDCIGDLALSGRRVRARITAHKPSHRGTVRFVRAMLDAVCKEKRVLGPEEIMKILPHRYPFLLVDRILELDPGKRVVGLKNVTINEPFFQGHFPGHAVMPGVLIIEAMAQVGGMLLLGAVDAPEAKVVYFMSLDNVKWRKPVKPGDQLRFELEVIQVRGRICKMGGVAKVDGEVVAEAEMAAMIRDR
jgi:UDP-3-O-[3-hydroxymyristoyl] N-acetylglucosamine deacetylase / 3-hydroxyacyl-[acyl-carrier-protein] dehydratase